MIGKLSTRKRATIYGAALALSMCCPLQAAEWGYEDAAAGGASKVSPKGETEPAPPRELKAAPAQALGVATPANKAATKPAGIKQASAKPAVSAKPPATGALTASGAAVTGSPKSPAAHQTARHTPAPTGINVNAASNRSYYADPIKERRRAVVIAWLEMYEAATPGQLTDDQILRIKDFYGKWLDKSNPKAEAVMAFWPKLRLYLEKNPEQQENYSGLIYALLRARTRPGGNAVADKVFARDTESSATAGNTTTAKPAGSAGGGTDDETELIGELLGPTRIAVQGTPPLTEDAVDAYADMACFLYEQKNPGKTIDAQENRALFSNVIMQKYKDAPTAADRAAMSNFPIGWAKFKVLWVSGDDASRKALLTKLTSSGVSSSAQAPADPMLAQVLKNWPL